mgnify:CR=1 FL=1
MKKTNIILGFILMASMFFWSCSKQETSNETTEETNTEASMEAEEAPSEEEIPSPLKKLSETVSGVQVEMQYGSPGVKGRTIWGELVPYGEVWRTGANEATWISFDKDITIQGNEVPAGKYGLFTIPNNDEWTVILNKTWDQWGAYDYNPEEDLIRFTVDPEMLETPAERMEFMLAENEVKFMWEKLAFAFKVAPAAE